MFVIFQFHLCSHSGCSPIFSKSQEPSDVKDLAAFARQHMESQTEKKDMSKASSEFAQSLLAGLGITVKLCEPETNFTEQAEPDQYLWKVQTAAGDQVKLGENQATPGARNWFHANFLANSELEKSGYDIKVATGTLLPTLKAAGKQAKGKGDMVIGIKTRMSPSLADNVYEQTPGLIELKTDEYPIKVGQMILEITAFSRISRYGKGVVLMASDCHTKWRLVWFNDYATIYRKSYKSGRRCWMDFVDLLKNAESRGNDMQPPRKKRLAVVNEDDTNEQDLDGFEFENDKKQEAVDNEAMLHRLANHLGDLYGERPVVPDWARAATTCPSYYM